MIFVKQDLERLDSLFIDGEDDVNFNRRAVKTEADSYSLQSGETLIEDVNVIIDLYLLKGLDSVDVAARCQAIINANGSGGIDSNVLDELDLLGVTV